MKSMYRVLFSSYFHHIAISVSAIFVSHKSANLVTLLASRL